MFCSLKLNCEVETFNSAIYLTIFYKWLLLGFIGLMLIYAFYQLRHQLPTSQSCQSGTAINKGLLLHTAQAHKMAIF